MIAPVTRLDESDQQWQSHVRQFAKDRIRPLSAEMDRTATLDPDLRKELFAEGLMSVEIPQEYGGTGGSLFRVMLTIEEVARVDPGVAVGVDVHNALIVATLLRQGSGDQRRRYLPLLSSGRIGAFALSEEQAGSDAFALATTARPESGGYVLQGRKRWTSNARAADLFLTFATIEGAGLSAFLVEHGYPGVSLDPRIEQLGVRASATSDVVFDDVYVRREQCVGGPGNGRSVAAQALDIGRVGIAAHLVGLAQGALDAAVDYSRGREQFGSSIADYQGVQFPLAEIATEIAAARALLYDVACQLVHPKDPVRQVKSAAMVKHFASQVAERSASLAVEVHGGNGYTDAYPVERFYRDAKAGKIYEGTSNILLRHIGALLLGEVSE